MELGLEEGRHVCVCTSFQWIVKMQNSPNMLGFFRTRLELIAKIAEFPVKLSPRIVFFLNNIIFGFRSMLICRQIN